MGMKEAKSTIVNGLLSENPTFRLVLGMCPTMGVTTMAQNGLGMGLATTAVLICSNVAISLLRKLIPDRIRIPAFVVIIATFVTMVDLLMKAFLPSLSEALGAFIPLIVVNCIVFARAESFAFKNKPAISAADGLGMGLGFTMSITLLSSVREILGMGTLFGMQIMPASYQPMAIMTAAPGGFITLGILMAIFNTVYNRCALKAQKA
jgi:electron transport complex protein RnfE